MWNLILFIFNSQFDVCQFDFVKKMTFKKLPTYFYCNNKGSLANITFKLVTFIVLQIQKYFIMIIHKNLYIHHDYVNSFWKSCFVYEIFCKNYKTAFFNIYKIGNNFANFGNTKMFY